MDRMKKASTQPTEEQQKAMSAKVSENSKRGEAKGTNRKSGVADGIASTQAGEENKDKFVELDEACAKLGGKERVLSRLTLDEALFKYKNKDEALSRFRELLSTVGANGIRKEKGLIQVVEAYGTIRDKAALVCICYFDLLTWGSKKPLITKSRVDKIRKEISKSGALALNEYTDTLAFYNALHLTKNPFFREMRGYFMDAYRSATYMLTYEWITKAEEMYSEFATMVDASKKREFEEFTKGYRAYLENFREFGNAEEKKGKEWLEKQITDLHACMRYFSDRSKTRLEIYKGARAGIQKWIADFDAAMFIPAELRQALASTPQVPEIQERFIKYNQSQEAVSRDLAVFPNHNEVLPDEDVARLYYLLVNENYKRRD